jgi:hypothetical protein
MVSHFLYYRHTPEIPTRGDRDRRTHTGVQLQLHSDFEASLCYDFGLAFDSIKGKNVAGML